MSTWRVYPPPAPPNLHLLAANEEEILAQDYLHHPPSSSVLGFDPGPFAKRVQPVEQVELQKKKSQPNGVVTLKNVTENAI